jgi:hypothetical protein
MTALAPDQLFDWDVSQHLEYQEGRSEWYNTGQYDVHPDLRMDMDIKMTDIHLIKGWLHGPWQGCPLWKTEQTDAEHVGVGQIYDSDDEYWSDDPKGDAKQFARTELEKVARQFMIDGMFKCMMGEALMTNDARKLQSIVDGPFRSEYMQVFHAQECFVDYLREKSKCLERVNALEYSILRVRKSVPLHLDIILALHKGGCDELNRLVVELARYSAHVRNS